MQSFQIGQSVCVTSNKSWECEAERWMQTSEDVITRSRGHEQLVSRSMHFLFWDTVNILKTWGPPCMQPGFYCVLCVFFRNLRQKWLRFYQEGCRLPWANRVDRKSRRRKIGNTTLFAVEQISCLCAHEARKWDIKINSIFFWFFPLRSFN